MEWIGCLYLKDNLMKNILVLALLCLISFSVRSQNAEKIIKSYLGGFEKKDWNMVSSQLAPDFTFTSPNGDDHLSISKFKERCWGQSELIKHVEFAKIIADGNTAIAIYNLITNEDKVIRNAEYYVFTNGKIKSVECFFGGTGAGYPSNVK
jgi:hypothetical protein